jgi:predicted dehydrogenase
MSRSLHRRAFMTQTSALGIALTAASRPRSSNERLRIGIIGTSNRGGSNLAGVQHEDIVALCDVDDRVVGPAAEWFPKAKLFHDYRKMLEFPGLDAVVVSTADHTHASATAVALRLGKHVYCEKPLTHSVHEARVVAELAANAGIATQMGTQIHAGENYRRVVELIRSGAIGPVGEVHVWCEGRWGGGERSDERPPVTAGLRWDLWLGPAPARPYHPDYLPRSWRRWWDFGCGTLGDMGCHFMDLPFWALDLSHPRTVEAEGPPVHPETTPEWLIVRYTFGERDGQPPVTLTWYDGGKKPKRLTSLALPGKSWGSGVLFVGEYQVTG